MKPSNKHKTLILLTIKMINNKSGYKKGWEKWNTLFGQKYVNTPLYSVCLSPQFLISELLFISQSRKPEQLVSLAADRSETNTAVSGLPGCPLIAAQPPFDQSQITIQSIDQRILSFCLCLFSVGAVCCETERRWHQAGKNITDKKMYWEAG